MLLLVAMSFLELQMKSKKKVLCVFLGHFKTHTRYSRVADEEQKKGLSGRLRLNIRLLKLKKAVVVEQKIKLFTRTF